MHQRVTRNDVGGLCTLTLNRPEALNAVNAQMHTELSDIFYDVQNDSDADIVVLTGAGKAFCAGCRCLH